MSSQPTHTIYVNSNKSGNTQQTVSSDSTNNASEGSSTASNASSLIQQAQQFQQLQQLQQLQQTVIRHPILDVTYEYQKQNYLPVLHCLRHNLIPKDFIDYGGYNILHHAVSQGSIPFTLVLLDHFKIDVNIRSRINQTPLMIACNYGFIEIIKILCERGASVNVQDVNKFSPLLYSIQHGHIPQLAYLLHQKADLRTSDVNGCTPAHWAAYKNNVFLLKVLARFGLDINGTDLTGMTPLDRAIQSDSCEATAYLLANGNGKLPPNLKFDSISNVDIKEMVRRKFFPTSWEKFKGKAKKLFFRHSQIITFATYGLLWISMMAMYLHVVMYKGFGYTFDLLFLLLGLYFIVYAFWYYMKSDKHSNKVKASSYQRLNKSSEMLEETLNTSTDKIQPRQKLNYEALDKLVRGEDKESIICEVESADFPSFLHELAWNFEMKNYKEFGRFDTKDYCPTCLTRRPERSAHPESSKTCIPHFHHYSYCLGKSVDKTNHFLYFIMLVKQMALLGMFIVSVWATQMDTIENGKVWFLETGYRLAVDYSFSYGGIYAVFLILAGYNLFFLWVEVYGILRNVTYYEIFNRNSFKRLYQMKLEKNGAYVNRHSNPYDAGAWENVKQYVRRILY